MSIDLNVSCKGHGKLLAADASLVAASYMAGYLPALAEMLMGPIRSAHCDEHVFDFVESEYDLEDLIFAEVVDDGRVELNAGKAARYLTKLLGILEKHSAGIPPVYFFREAGESDLIMEARLGGGVSIEAGYDFCVVVRDEDVEDMRDASEVVAEGRKFAIVRPVSSPWRYFR